MPIKLSLHSEQYASTGNIGDNFRRLLGTPSLDPLQTVIREAVQNIADAALPPTGPEILIRLRRLTRGQRRILHSHVLSTSPPEPRSRELFDAMRSRNALTVMEICDFGTKGLGGPTRSDRIPVADDTTDFIDFLRNIGTARDTDQGGGTYGFGKVALYRASRSSTIVVDTLPHGAGPSARRLIGCHVGRSFERPDDGYRARFTGRHWWGVPDPKDEIVDPVTGRAARELASALGFPARSGDQSGTSIMILNFDAVDEDLQSVGRRVVEGLLWNFWPRMMHDAPAAKRFACRVEVNDSPLEIPLPENFPPLDLYSKAMRAARARTGNDIRSLFSQRPVRRLGTLAIEKGQRAPRRPLVSEDSLFPEASHQIALMRPVELVVKYLEGTALPDERLEWAGVFVASSEDEVESAFSDSEPPAHDDWICDGFPPRSRAKHYVRSALWQLRETARDIGAAATGPTASAASGPPLARAAGRLGDVLERVGGDGAGQQNRRGGSGPSHAS